jgi:hypothetical protein
MLEKHHEHAKKIFNSVQLKANLEVASLLRDDEAWTKERVMEMSDTIKRECSEKDRLFYNELNEFASILFALKQPKEMLEMFKKVNYPSVLWKSYKWFDDHPRAKESVMKAGELIKGKAGELMKLVPWITIFSLLFA